MGSKKKGMNFIQKANKSKIVFDKQKNPFSNKFLKS